MLCLVGISKGAAELDKKSDMLTKERVDIVAVLEQAGFKTQVSYVEN